jgi:hypothetical protein
MHLQFCFFSRQLICLSLVQEWGDPREEEYYYYMKLYSPVDNVSAGLYEFLDRFTKLGLHLMCSVLKYVGGTTDSSFFWLYTP